jgi:hypothetical protein
MISTHELYVYPYPIRTCAATTNNPDNPDKAELASWEHKKAGEYLYLHPNWYIWDQQGKLLLVGKSTLKSESGKVHASMDDMRLELEMLTNMPLNKKLTVKLATMNSMIVLTSNPDEPEHMFHPGAHVVVARHLYKVDKKGVLRPVGELHGEYRHELISECLLMMGVPDTCDLNIAPDYQWKDRSPFDDEEKENKPETEEEIIQYMMDGFNYHLKRQKKLPVVGDHFVVTSPEGHKLEAYCLPIEDTDIVPVHPIHGKPAYKMAVKIFNPDGTTLFEK